MTAETNAERLERIRKDYDSHNGLSGEDLDFVFDQAERVQELERKIGEVKDGIYWDELQLLHWKAENARLREVLSVYANSSNYEPFSEEEDNRSDAFNFVDLDGGEIARQALKGE